jgi:hypothetical protein
MRDIKKEKEFAQHVPKIFQYLQSIPNPDISLSKSIIGFVADMGTCYGKDIKVLLTSSNFVADNLSKLKMSKIRKIQEFVDWAEDILKVIMA